MDAKSWKGALLLLCFVYAVLARALFVSMTASTLRLLLARIRCTETHASAPANIPAAASISNVSLTGELGGLGLYAARGACLL